MNTELKNILDVVFAGVEVGEDITKKNYMELLGDMMKLANEVPEIISGYADIQPELLALKDPANQADLLQYIETKFKGVFTGDKANEILTLSLNLVKHAAVVAQDVVALTKAIKS